MRNRYILGIAIFVILLSSTLSTLAGEERELIEVTATGVGKDSDGALKNALRAAIEQAVGTLVDSETLASNDEIVNDQILSYSAGFVESHKVVGEPKMSDGLVSIKIIAKIRRTQLTEKLKAASIHVREVDGGSLFGEAITKLEQKQSGEEIITKAFDGFPENVLEVKMIGKPSYGENAKKVILDIEISVKKDAYSNFIKYLNDILNKVSNKSDKTSQQSKPIVHANALSVDFLQPVRDRKVIAVCTRINEARTNGNWEMHYVSQEILNAAASVINIPVFSVDIIDGNGDTIVSGKYDSPAPYSLHVLNWFKNANYPNPQMDSIAIFPILDNRPSSGVFSQVIPGTEKTIVTVSFDVSPNELKKMKNVVCKIERGKE